jgi:hypothetical protein
VDDRCFVQVGLFGEHPRAAAAGFGQVSTLLVACREHTSSPLVRR